MANTVAPERRRYRPFFILGLPILFLACVGVAGWVMTTSQNVYLATPFLLAAFALIKLIRWTMLWVSSPEERRVLARNMDREPLIGLFREFLRRHWGGQQPPQP
jgi:hypothetical protein